MFYMFRQNNNGGIILVDEYVTKFVVIEADNLGKANYRAEGLGLYFDGCGKEIDCSCCGDRWQRIKTEKDGFEFPALYGEPIETSNNNGLLFDYYIANSYYPAVYVYYLNGKKDIWFFDPDDHKTMIGKSASSFDKTIFIKLPINDF